MTSNEDAAPQSLPANGETQKGKIRHRYMLEELLIGMKPERGEFMEDDWPVGAELI